MSSSALHRRYLPVLQLKLYNSIQAIRASRLPSNAQVDSLITYLQRKVDDMKTVDSSICKDTQQLFTDLSTILESLRAEIHDKNKDEIIQEFIWNTRLRELKAEATDAAASSKKEPLPVDKDKAKEDADQGKPLLCPNFPTPANSVI